MSKGLETELNVVEALTDIRHNRDDMVLVLVIGDLHIPYRQVLQLSPKSFSS